MMVRCSGLVMVVSCGWICLIDFFFSLVIGGVYELSCLFMIGKLFMFFLWVIVRMIFDFLFLR